MLLSTPGLVLHTTPYAESSVVVKVFTRQLGVQSYIIKGVRGARGRVKQNLLQPLSCLDMVVYDNSKTDLNYVKEISPRHPEALSDPVWNALRFFMTEVLYKALRESEPMPDLWDYVERVCSESEGRKRDIPVRFLLKVALHLGIEPLDNYSSREPYFDLQEGRYVSAPMETSLPLDLSSLLHQYLSSPLSPLSTSPPHPLCPGCHRHPSYSPLLNALLTYYHLHLSGFANFRSHEILHTILK